MTPVVMIICQDNDRCNDVMEVIRSLSAHMLSARSAAEVVKRCASEQSLAPDVVLFIPTPDEEAVEAIRSLRSAQPEIPIILLAPYSKAADLEQAVHAGAHEVMLSPAHPVQLMTGIRNALLSRQLSSVMRTGSLCQHMDISLDDIPTVSGAMASVQYFCKQVKDSESPLILESVSGSTRELLARAMHIESIRAPHPFHVFHPMLYPAEEHSTLLFGDEKKLGILARVGKGTFLLRGAESLSSGILQRLQRVLLGGEAVNPQWPEHFYYGRTIFTADHHYERPDALQKLFAAIEALPVSIPPLSSTKEDIPEWVRLFCRRFALLEGKVVTDIHPGVFQLLERYSWIGDREQLSQAVFRAVQICEDSTLAPEHFQHLISKKSAEPVPLVVGAAPRKDGEAEPTVDTAGFVSCMDEAGNIHNLHDVEQAVIRFALERYNGHMSKVARDLGIGRSTLYRKLSVGDDA